MAGKVVHFEIPVDDGERAIAFYGQSLGWQLEREGPLEYWTTPAGQGQGIGGALTKRDPQAPGLTLYIEVDDIDKTLIAIEASGGRRLTERLPIPTVGWTAFFTDTEGNRLGLFQADATAGSGMGNAASFR
jgi:predicted enzyme related to lactoylglutathione lyase